MKSNMRKGQYTYFEDLDSNECKSFENNQQIFVREKFSEYGIDCLVPSEAISLLTGIDCLKLQSYIKKFGLRKLHNYTGIMGLNKRQEEKLKLLYKTVDLINTCDIDSGVTIESLSVGAELFQKLLGGYAVEVLAIACLNARMRVIAIPIVCKGDISENYIYIRQFIKLAMDHNAVSVIVAHNHPSGIVTPSAQDKELTQKIKEALRVVDIKLVDHFIVSGNRYFSFAEEGLLYY